MRVAAGIRRKCGRRGKESRFCPWVFERRFLKKAGKSGIVVSDEGKSNLVIWQEEEEGLYAAFAGGG